MSQPGPIARLVGRAQQRWESLLQEIEQTGEVEAALGLLPIGLASRGVFRDEALAVLDRLVRGCPPGALAGLEARARDRDSSWRRDAWVASREVSPERLASVSDRATALGVASLHASGWVREEAVRLLARSDEPLAIAFLLIRANDWVEQVSQRAMSSIEARLAQRGAGELVPYLDLVYRLEGVRRNDLRSLVHRVEGAIASPAASALLRQACTAGTRRSRRRCLELALRVKTFDLRPVLRSSLDDPDPVIRVVVARAVGEAFDADELRRILGEMRSNRSPSVRRAALEIVADRLPAESRPVQERLLFDSNAFVRSMARWYLRSTPGFDAAGRYRDALKSGAQEPVAALLGLGETGSGNDAPLVEPFLAHERARLRATAVSVLGRLAPDDHRDRFIQLLADPSPRVARAARDLLLRQRALELRVLIDAALRGESPSHRRCGVDLVARHDHWTAGLAWLRIAREGGEDASARARAALRTWADRYNRVFTLPTPEQLVEYRRETATLARNDPFGNELCELVTALDGRVRPHAR